MILREINSQVASVLSFVLIFSKKKTFKNTLLFSQTPKFSERGLFDGDESRDDHVVISRLIPDQ